MAAIITLLVVALLSLLVARIATVALTTTGLSRESARFQARSALTGVGFTTGEAENVVNHPVRRRIILGLMLLSNVGVASVMAALILGFASAEGPQRFMLRAGLLVAGLAALLLLSKNPRADRALSTLVAKILCRYTNLPDRDFAWMLRLHGDYAVAELQVQEGDWLAGTSLAKADLPHEGIVVLGVIRADGTYLGAPSGDTVLYPQDVVMLYGRAPVLAELDERPAGSEGDAAHEHAVEDHRRVVHDERFHDPRRTTFLNP